MVLRQRAVGLEVLCIAVCAVMMVTVDWNSRSRLATQQRRRRQHRTELFYLQQLAGVLARALRCCPRRVCWHVHSPAVPAR